jgi:hypothetical protein
MFILLFSRRVLTSRGFRIWKMFTFSDPVYPEGMNCFPEPDLIARSYANRLLLHAEGTNLPMHRYW